MRVLIPISEVLKIRVLRLEKYRELIELMLLSSISFFIPVLIGHPQILVGIVVNALIVRSALTMERWKNLPTIFLPCLGALSRGILFGPFTFYLFNLIPFIWLGNFILAYFTKVFSQINVKLSFAIQIIVPGILKGIVIFLPTLLLVHYSVIPASFLSSMGLTQFITAIMGSLLAQGVTKKELSYLSKGEDYE